MKNLLLLLTVSYCLVDIYNGYRLSAVDVEIKKTVGNVQSWCSNYDRNIYGFSLRKFGCKLRDQESKK